MAEVVLKYGDLSSKGSSVQACIFVLRDLPPDLGVEAFIGVLSPPSEALAKEVRGRQVAVHGLDEVQLVLRQFGIFPAAVRTQTTQKCQKR